MKNVNTQKILDELNNRKAETLELQDGDQVRLENGIYTAGEHEDGLGFEMTIEDHTADIPFIGEIYYGGNQPTESTPLEDRTFIKEHDIVKYADVSYMVVCLHQTEFKNGYTLIALDSLKDAAKALLDRI